MDYNMIKHFSAYLEFKEPDIPEEIVLLFKECKTISDIRSKMKLLRLNKYYEYTNYIWHKIMGQEQPYIEPEMKSQLIHLYTIIYNLHRSLYPRESALPIAYIMPKLLCFIEAPINIKILFVYNLRSKEKMARLDAKWEKIMDCLVIRSKI
jgi:hypothetical protein